MIRTNILKQHSGFTLIELITVVVLLGIIASIGSSFMVKALDTYQVSETRSRLIQRGRLTMEQMAREIRMSVPNSQRVSATNNCLEFMPIVSASRYLSNIATQENNATQKSFVTTEAFNLGLGSANYFVISPFSPTEVYSNSNPSAIVPVASLVNSPITRVNFSAAHRFTRSSNAQRFFIGGDPVRFCLLNGSLQRASDYGFDTGVINDSLPNGTVDLMGQNISTDGNAFSISPGAVDKHALVTVQLNFASDGLVIPLENKILIRNGP